MAFALAPVSFEAVFPVPVDGDNAESTVLFSARVDCQPVKSITVLRKTGTSNATPSQEENLTAGISEVFPVMDGKQNVVFGDISLCTTFPGMVGEDHFSVYGGTSFWGRWPGWYALVKVLLTANIHITAHLVN